MDELIWSFVDSLESGEEGDTFRLVYRSEVLREIGYPARLSCVPPGLLIEGAAQASGLTLFREDPEFHSLPVLARVNRATFPEPANLDRNFQFTPQLDQINETGALFLGEVLDGVSGKVVGELEILLGFVPFSDLPQSGEMARSRLKNFLSDL